MSNSRKNNSNSRSSRSSRSSRTTRKNRSNNIINTINNSRIGKGAFGTVHRPPKKCANKNLSQYYSDKYVSKLTESFSAEKEFEVGMYIRKHIKNYKDYYCLVNNTCKALKEDQQFKNGEYRDYLSYMLYCGPTLDSFLSENELYPELTWYLLDLLCSLIEGIQLLHRNNIFHLDIHINNIVYNNYNLLLIDFGNAEWPYNNLTNKIILNYTVQDNDMLLNMVIVPILSHIFDTKVLNVKGYEKLHTVLDKLYKKMYSIKDIYSSQISESYILRKQNEIISEFVESIPLFREGITPNQIKN